MQLSHVLGQNAAGRLVRFIHNITDLIINFGRRIFGIALALAKVSAKEGFARVGAINHRAHALREAIAGHHGAGGIRGTLQVVGSTGGDIIQHQLLRHTAAQQADNVLVHGGLGHIAGVFFRQIHGKAACRTTRDNADLVHGIMRFAEIAGNGMAGLVVRGQALFGIGHNAALLFGASHNLDGSFLDFGFGDGLFALARSQQGGFVDKVFQVGTGEARGGLGDGFQADIGAKGLVLGVNAQNLLAALHIRQTNINLTVKTAGTQQRLIQNIGAVGGSHHDNAVVGVKAVHLNQQLVQGLLALVMPAAKAGTTLTAHGIDLINKDDGGHCLFGFFKQIAHTGCADTDIHFHKVGTRDGIERNAGLARTGTGQQRFAGARRADKQNAVGNARPQGVELFRCFQELNHFLEFSLFFIRTGNIGKGCLALAFLLVLDLGTANIHQAAATGTAAVHGHEEQHHAADHKGVQDDFKPGHVGLNGDHIVLHGRIRVGCIILVDIILEVELQEIRRIWQLVGNDRCPAVLGGVSIGVIAVNFCKQAVGCFAGRAGFRQRMFTFFHAHLDNAGVQVQVKVGDLIGFKVPHGFGQHHGALAGGKQAGIAGDHHECCHHQDSGNDNAAETRFVLQKINSLSKSAKTAGDWLFCQDRILFGIYFRF